MSRMSFMMPGSADSDKLIPGQQLGGLIAHPMQSQLAERRIPEMVVPLQGTDRSRGFLSQAAIAIGSQSTRGRMEGQQQPVSVNAPITVTVNGAPVGQEGAVAREVKRAMEDPIRTLLDQIKAARAYEARSAQTRPRNLSTFSVVIRFSAARTGLPRQQAIHCEHAMDLGSLPDSI